MAYAAEGFRTLGIDLDAGRVRRLMAGQNYIQDVDDETLHHLVDAGRFVARDNYASIGEADVIFICVPTPVTPHKDPDTSYIEGAARLIAEHLRPGQLILLKSTTYPNTTEECLQPILERIARPRGMEVGRDYYLAFSPERIDPGNEHFTTENTPVVVGGVTEGCTEIATLVLKQIVAQVHPVASPRVAEMAKLLENIFRSVNIALVNELARLCDRMGDLSIWEVVEAAATKPFGFMPFYPGPGLGGHCIPIDPYYLSWLARKYDFETSFITLAARVNEEMPFYVGTAVLRAVAHQPVCLDDARVLILGVAYKKDVGDMRESPALDVIRLLAEKGATISFHDPHVRECNVEGTLYKNSDLSDEVLGGADLVVILTDHSSIDYEHLVEKSHRVFDTRNATSAVAANREKITKL